MVDSIMQKMELEDYSSFSAAQIGNTGSSSIPIMMKILSAQSRDYLPEGYSVVCGFGIGLSIVVALLEVRH